MGKEKAKKEDAVATAKLCFVIMPIGSEGSEIRQRSDKVFEYMISDVVKEMGYEPLRGDHLHKGGRITNQIIELLIDAPLVVADLTGMNPNVVYELAIRHAARKPVVHIGEGTEGLPFDFYDMRMVMFDRHDIGSVHKAREAIAAHIRTLGETGSVDSPISNALDLRAMKDTGDPEARNLAKAFEDIAQIRFDMARFAQLLGTMQRAFNSGKATANYALVNERIAVQTRSGSPATMITSLETAVDIARVHATEEERATLDSAYGMAVWTGESAPLRRMCEEILSRISMATRREDTNSGEGE